jgi:hypothetical protein
MSAAFKYVVTQVFSTPFDVVDSETESHEVAPKQKQEKTKAKDSYDDI